MNPASFANLDDLATFLRQELGNKKYLLLYAYNGTGKTRLSMAFKEAGKQGDQRDTLYFNAFTEDLFTWDNDLDGDSERVLKINSSSSFFSGIEELEMENRIRPCTAMLISISASTTRKEPLVFPVKFREKLLITSRCHAAKKISLSGAFSSPLSSWQWMVRKHITGLSISILTIPFLPWMKTMQ
jgi:hypothetical protein